MVKIGESAFRIPVRELSRFVSAKANSTDGIRFPTIPVKKMTFHLPFGTFFRFLTAAGRRNKNAKVILIVPTCNAEKTTRPFLIRMYELPHIKASVTSRIHDSTFSDFSKFLYSLLFLIFYKIH